MSEGKIYVLGLNHTCANLELREKLALQSETSLFMQAGFKLDKKAELVIISTCNRVEIVAYSADNDAPAKIIEIWAQLSGQPEDLIRQHIYIKEDKVAILHVFLVACSLDSMLLGESQILGQVKQAFAQAVKDGASKTILNKLFHRAFFTAKEVRTKTKIGCSSTSISHTVIDMAKNILAGFSGKKALIVGAGQMARLAALRLNESGCSELFFANRTEANARKLSIQIGGRAVKFNEIAKELETVDLLVSSCAGANYLITPSMFKNRKSTQLLAIDIGMPRNIDPEVGDIFGIRLLNLDDIQSEISNNKQKRTLEAEKALAILECQVNSFVEWKKALALKPTIADLFRHTEAIAQAEFKKTIRKIGPLDPEIEESMSAMLSSVLKKINHEPVTYIKRLHRQHGDVSRQIAMLRSFFNLDSKK